VLLDGTLIPTRRRPGTANRKNYNGKHKIHGLLFLALTDETGKRGSLTPSVVPLLVPDSPAGRLKPVAAGGPQPLCGVSPDRRCVSRAPKPGDQERDRAEAGCR